MMCANWTLKEQDKFRKCFERFEGDDGGNDWSAVKETKRGKVGLIVKVHVDWRVEVMFGDFRRHIFPFEALRDPSPSRDEVLGFEFIVLNPKTQKPMRLFD